MSHKHTHVSPGLKTLIFGFCLSQNKIKGGLKQRRVQISSHFPLSFLFAKETRNLLLFLLHRFFTLKQRKGLKKSERFLLYPLNLWTSTLFVAFHVWKGFNRLMMGIFAEFCESKYRTCGDFSDSLFMKF